MFSDLVNMLTGGQAFLHGQPLYAHTEWYYPAPLVLLYALLALLPFWAAAGAVFAANLTALVVICKRQAVYWLLFMPVTLVLMQGQNDLWFVAGERFITRGKRSAFLAALLTLKPQMALILLPWHILDWWKSDRRTLAWFAGITALLWLVPFDWQADWLAKIAYSPDRYFSPSIWRLPLPVWVLLPIAAALIVYGLKSRRDEAIPAFQAASPVGIIYNTSALITLAPARLLIPLSWAVWFVCSYFETPVLFVLLPLVTLAWQKRGAIGEQTLRGALALLIRVYGEERVRQGLTNS